MLHYTSTLLLFLQQKPSYELRLGDCSSYLCSSDLFQIDFDFIGHALLMRVSDGDERQLPLAPRPVAEFHDELLGALDALGISVRLHESPKIGRASCRERVCQYV